MHIPARKPGNKARKIRKFMAQLPAAHYLAFEAEALARDVSTAELADVIIRTWLDAEGVAPLVPAPSPSPVAGEPSGGSE